MAQSQERNVRLSHRFRQDGARERPQSGRTVGEPLEQHHFCEGQDPPTPVADAIDDVADGEREPEADVDEHEVAGHRREGHLLTKSLVWNVLERADVFVGT